MDREKLRFRMSLSSLRTVPTESLFEKTVQAFLVVTVKEYGNAKRQVILIILQVSRPVFSTSKKTSAH